MKKLENDLMLLRQKLVEMGNLTEQMVLQATAALEAWLRLGSQQLG